MLTRPTGFDELYTILIGRRCDVFPKKRPGATQKNEQNISNKHSKVNGRQISHKFMDLHKIEIMKRLKNKNKILQRHSRSTFCGRFECASATRSFFFQLGNRLMFRVVVVCCVFLWHRSVLSYHQRL